MEVTPIKLQKPGRDQGFASNIVLLQGEANQHTVEV